MGRLRAAWHHPAMEKWGRIALLMIPTAVAFLFFTYTDTSTGTDNVITIFFVVALATGIFASIATTSKYELRPLSLLFATTGACLYFLYLYLVRSGHKNHYWMTDLVRSLFLVASPIFALTTVYALIVRTETMAQKDKRINRLTRQLRAALDEIRKNEEEAE